MNLLPPWISNLLGGPQRPRPVPSTAQLHLSGRGLADSANIDWLGLQIKTKERQISSMKAQVDQFNKLKEDLLKRLRKEDSLHRRTAQKIRRVNPREYVAATNDAYWFQGSQVIMREFEEQKVRLSSIEKELSRVNTELEAARTSLTEKNLEIKRLNNDIINRRDIDDRWETMMKQKYADLEATLTKNEKDHKATIDEISEEIHTHGRVLHPEKYPYPSHTHAWETITDPKAEESLKLIDQTVPSKYEPITHNDLKAMVGFYINNFDLAGYTHVRNLLRKKMDHNIKEARLDRQVLIVFSDVIERILKSQKDPHIRPVLRLEAG